MSRQRNPLLRHTAIVMIVLLLNSELAFGSWLSEITGVDINVPAGTVSFSNPRPDAIPDMLKNLPADVLEFATNCLLTRGACPGVWMATLVRQAKAQAQGGSQPIPNDIRKALETFFPAYILDKARWILTDPGRSPLEGMIFGGGCPDVQILGLYVSCSNGALTLDNVIVFKDEAHREDPFLWAHELTHVSQYDGMGIDGFAFAYTLDPGSLEGQAYAWENTVRTHPPQNSQPTQQYWTMAPVRRVALTANDFAVGAARLSSNPAWRQTHSGWGSGEDCRTASAGTDTGPAPNAVALDRLGVSLTKNGRAQEGILQIKRAICVDKFSRNPNPNFRGDLASAYLANGNVDAAIIEYWIALWFNPRNAQFHRELAAAFERRGDNDAANAQNWQAVVLAPGAYGAGHPLPAPPIPARQSTVPIPPWLTRSVTWKSERTRPWSVTVAGRGCAVDVAQQVLFDPKPNGSLLVYTEDTLLSENPSDFCLDHSDDPGVEKHIYLRLQIKLEPKQDGTIVVSGSLEDPCSHCKLPQYFPTPTVSGTITRRTDREFWLAVSGAVFGGFEMRPAD